MKLKSKKIGFFVLFLAFGVWLLFLRSPSFPWHQGPKWEKLLRIYDKMAKDKYSECDSRSIATKFGNTQIHACGESSKPAVLFFHGAGSNSLMYGDWLIPPLKNTHYSVAVDYPCDVGRSSPRDGDTKNCPQTQEDLAEWTKEILQHLHIQNRPVSMVGYSYGSLITASIALVAPQMVDKLILIAPAAVLAPIEGPWLLRALLYALWPGPWFLKWMSTDPDFSLDKMSETDRALTEAIGDLRATVLALNAYQFPKEDLSKIVAGHPTLVIVGEQETVTNATIVVNNAKEAGAQVELWPGAGHLLLMENPREPLKKSVSEFLSKTT